jgi:hypothetical protein
MSIAFGRCYHDAGAQMSMGTAGDCFDNATCDGFFSALEC